MVYSRTSLDITAFSNLSDATPEIIAPSDLFHALDNILGPDYTSTGSLADGNSPIGYILYNYIDIFTDPAQNESRSINDTDLLLGGLVSLPILMSQPTTGLAGPDEDLSIPQVGLASNLYFSVDLSKSKLIAAIPRWVVIVYLVVSATVYVCCVLAMVLSLQAPGDQPPISSFEVLNLASKAVALVDDKHDAFDHESRSFADLLSRLKTGSDQEIRKRLQRKRLFVQGRAPSRVIDG